MITPTIRSDGATRRFVVHAAHQTREQGRVVRAASFHEAALAYAEAWRPVPDAFGVIQLSLTDLDSGEHQNATIDVARPGVADLQVRRERLEMRAAARTELPGAERFRVDPVDPFVIAATAKPQPRNYRQLAMNAAALVAVVLVTFLVVSQVTRDRFSRAPWEQDGVVAQQPAPRLTAATALLRPPAQPQVGPAPAATAQPNAAYVPTAPARRAPSVRNIPMDELGPSAPQVTVSGALEIPAVETAPAAEAPAEAAPAPLIVRRGGEDEALGSRSGPEEAPTDEITERLNQALEAPAAP